MTTPLEQIQLRRAEEQAACAFATDGVRKTRRCEWDECRKLITDWNKSGLCERHLRVMATRRWSAKHGTR